MAHSKIETRQGLICEQINMFGERDPANIVVDWLKTAYEHKEEEYDERDISFEKFVLDKFSTWSGGSASQTLRENGYIFYGFSPSGVELARQNFSDKVFIKKSVLLKMLNIKDDHKDILKDEE